jgi:hypothetical protein
MSAMVASKPVSTATPMPRSRRKTKVDSAPATGDSVRSYEARMQVTKVVRASSAQAIGISRRVGSCTLRKKLEDLALVHPHQCVQLLARARETMARGRLTRQFSTAPSSCTVVPARSNTTSSIGPMHYPFSHMRATSRRVARCKLLNRRALVVCQIDEARRRGIPSESNCSPNAEGQGACGGNVGEDGCHGRRLNA